MPEHTIKDTLTRIMEHERNLSPEQAFTFYRENLFPHVTFDEAQELHRLLNNSLDAKTKREREEAFKAYQRALAPVKKRETQIARTDTTQRKRKASQTGDLADLYPPFDPLPEFALPDFSDLRDIDII